jgi:hypothetical protein
MSSTPAKNKFIKRTEVLHVDSYSEEEKEE